MRLRKYGGRQKRFGPAPDAIFRRCPRCGGQYDEAQMRKLDEKLICGQCYLIDHVWNQKEGQ
jgi:formylmethanofuran dehydrogenase subunit E